MVAECVCGPHVRHSLPALLCNCPFFFLSFCRILRPPLITPSYLLPALRLPPCIRLAYSSFHLPPGPPCIIVTRTSPEHAPASTRPCTWQPENATNWSARTVKIICMGSGGAGVLLSCTATHCVHAKLRSLLVERCYALLSSGEGKHPVASTGYQQLPTPPPAAPAQHSVCHVCAEL